MKVGLVLGAGGVMGGAWLTGGLEALARETGWDPGSADHIVGTSAGSMMGALLAADIPPWFMVAHSNGEVFDGLEGPDGRAAADADRSGGAVFRLERRFPRIGPGSWSLIAQRPAAPEPAHADRGHLRPAARGRHLERAAQGHDPPRRPGRLARPPEPLGRSPATTPTGRRVPFGRADAPPAEIGDAVAASCAIPGFYRPVTIGGKRYVDGGVWSTSNLDILRDDAARPRHLPQPDVVAPPAARVEPGRTGSRTSSAARPGACSAARRSCSAPRAPRSC